MLVLLGALLVFVAVLLVFTFTFSSKQISVQAIDPIEVSPNAASHLATALSIPTVSTDDPAGFDSTAFDAFAKFMVQTYPLTDSLLARQTFNDYAFLYKWKGKQSSEKPILLYAHLDVVPVPEGNLRLAAGR